MIKKSIIISIIVVLVVISSIYLLTRPKVLGNLNHNYSEQTTTTSDISFLGEAGGKLKFSFKSNIENGNLDIILYDSMGNEVYRLDKAKELETFFNLTNSDTYTLKAECSEFIGKYDVKVFEIN